MQSALSGRAREPLVLTCDKVFAGQGQQPHQPHPPQRQASHNTRKHAGSAFGRRVSQQRLLLVLNLCFCCLCAQVSTQSAP